MGAIQDRIDDGSLVLYHDYRAGHADDLRGQGNDGVASGGVWSRDGIRFGSSDLIVGPDAPELQLTTGAILALVSMSNLSTAFIVDKRDAGGTNYSFGFNADTAMKFFDGAGISTINHVADMRTLLAVNFENGEKSELFAKGVSIGLFNVAETISVDDADLSIGGRYNGGEPVPGTISAILVCNRPLTPTEHAAVYAELNGMTWPHKVDRAATAYAAAATELQYGTDWGTPVTANRTAGQFVGPFEIISGTHKVVADEIEGKIVKAIENVVAGVDSIPVAQMRQLPSDAAYGTFDWWEYTPATGISNIGIVCQNPVAAAAGDLRLQIDGTAGLAHLANPATTTIIGSIPFTPAQWNRWRITRSAGNEFKVYLNGTLMGTATYAGVTSGYYMTADQDAGCKRSLADVGAGHAYNKFQGVVAP